MTHKVEQWLPIAREIIRGTYLPAEIPREKLFDKEAESQALAEWLASHAPSEQQRCPTCKCKQSLPRGVFCTNKFHSEAAAQPKPIARYCHHCDNWREGSHPHGEIEHNDH